MKLNIFTYTKDRSFIANLFIAILCFFVMFIISTFAALFIHRYIKDAYVCTILADLFYILILYLVFLKDLNHEAKVYFSDFKNKFKKSFKTYLLGFMGMIFFNLFITFFLKEISSNEEQVREMLYNSVFTSMISISIIAPILEELIFRKSLAPLFKNKWVYSIICGLLF